MWLAELEGGDPGAISWGMLSIYAQDTHWELNLHV